MIIVGFDEFFKDFSISQTLAIASQLASIASNKISVSLKVTSLENMPHVEKLRS